MPSQTASSLATDFDADGSDRALLTRERCLQILAWVGIALLILRLVLMLAAPLADTTEARYGEIARLTLSDGFWLMPHIDANTPFFAKPPLSTWVASASMYVFGISEFAARLPSLLLSALTVLVAMAFAAELKLEKRWLVFPVLAAAPLFMICAGAVMTDAVQACVVSAALYFAWRTFASAEDAAVQRWRLAFWAMIGLGALCKGLANWALIGLPLVLYAVLEKRVWALARRLLDWRGILLACAIFVPWYVAAERHYPGFLDYFIVGEHFKRFLVPGWKGDRYGNAHREALGMIWAFWAVAILPWLPYFVQDAIRVVRSRAAALAPLEKFLWCATLAPLIFFTFAHNIIWTYGLTPLVPFAVLVAQRLEKASTQSLRIAALALLAMTVAMAALLPLFLRNISGNSDRDLVATFVRTAPANAPLTYLFKPTYSAHFYARDRLAYAAHTALADIAPAATPRFFVVETQQADMALPSHMRVLFHGPRHSLLETRP